jgi:hypothetical protein
MSHHTKDKGDLAVAKTIAHLLEHNIRVCLPLSEHLPFDFIAVMPDMRSLQRVQVKYRKDIGTGALALNFRSNYYDSKKIYSKPTNLEELDAYAVYCPETDENYYFQVADIPVGGKGLVLRITPPRNGQTKGVWFARDFKIPFKKFLSQVNEAPKQRFVTEQNEFVAAQVITDLMGKGWQVCVPNSAYIPFDLVAIAPDMTTLTRVCVGYQSVQPNAYADQYAIFEATTKAVRYIEANELGSKDRELQNGRRHV